MHKLIMGLLGFFVLIFSSSSAGVASLGSEQALFQGIQGFHLVRGLETASQKVGTFASWIIFNCLGSNLLVI